MKKMSMNKRMELAERRERDARRRMDGLYARMQKANAISDGARIFVTTLASMIGEEVHITKEQQEKAKQLKYEVRRNEDGSMDMRLVE